MKKTLSTWCLNPAVLGRLKYLAPNGLEMLREAGFDVESVAETALKGHEDEEIVALAKEEDRVIITNDVGSGSIYYFSERGKVGIIILRIHPPTIEDVNTVLTSFLGKVNLEKKKLTKKLIVLTKKKYRVIK